MISSVRKKRKLRKIYASLVAVFFLLCVNVAFAEDNAYQSDENIVKRAEKSAEYLIKAKEQLEEKNYIRAKDYVDKALRITPDNRQAKVLLEEADHGIKARDVARAKLIEERAAKRAQALEIKKEKVKKKKEQREARLKAEKAKKEALRKEREEQSRLKEEKRREEAEYALKKKEAAEIKRKAEREVRRKEIEASKAKKKAEAAAREQARREKKAKLAAERAAKRAQALESKKEKVKKKKERRLAEAAERKQKKEEVERLKEAERAEEISDVGRKKSDEARLAERERQRKENLAAKEFKQKEAKDKKIVKKVSKKIAAAEKYFSKKKYSDARRKAYEARDLAPQDSTTAELITRIDKEEMFGARVEREKNDEVRIAKALAKEEKADDPMTRHDEGKGWQERIADIFKVKTYELGDVQPGRTYTIDECVQLALARSHRLKMADGQVKLAEMRVWEARRDLFPEVTGTYEMSSGKISSDNYQRHYKGRRYKVGVKQTLFDGFGTWYAVRQSQTNLAIVKLERDKIVNELASETKRAYYLLDKSIKALDIQDRHHKKVNALFDITEKAHQEELISKTEYLKIKGQNLQANFSFFSAEEDTKLAKLVLFQAMNFDPEGDIEVKPVIKPSQTISIGLENCYKLALANQPDIKIKEKTIAYYDLERKMMKSKAWPKIYFDGSFGAAMERFEPMFLAADQTSDNAGSAWRAHRDMEAEWYAGAKGSIPLWGNTFEYNYVKEKWAPTVSTFKGSESATSYFTLKFLDDMKYFSNLQEARIGIDRAKYEYNKAKKDLMVEVKEMFFKYKKALLNIDVAEAQLEHQRMYVDVLDERRRLAERETSRQIEEMEKLTEYEYGLEQGYTDYFVSLVELNKSIGIPEHFKPDYENTEYAAWKKELDHAEVERNKEKIAGYLEKAKKFFDKKSFKKAHEYAEKALGADPENLEAKDLLSKIKNVEADNV